LQYLRSIWWNYALRRSGLLLAEHWPARYRKAQINGRGHIGTLVGASPISVIGQIPAAARYLPL
jgi:hypothetical protein